MLDDPGDSEVLVCCSDVTFVMDICQHANFMKFFLANIMRWASATDPKTRRNLIELEERYFHSTVRLLEDLILLSLKILSYACSSLCLISSRKVKNSVIHRARGFWPLITIYEASSYTAHSTHMVSALQKIENPQIMIIRGDEHIGGLATDRWTFVWMLTCKSKWDSSHSHRAVCQYLSIHWAPCCASPFVRITSHPIANRVQGSLWDQNNNVRGAPSAERRNTRRRTHVGSRR